MDDFQLDGKTAGQSVHLKADRSYPAKVFATADLPLTYSWEVMEESGAKTTGGDFETQPQSFPGLVSPGSGGEAQIKAPSKPGAYRLFVYVLNGHDKAAYANIPFYVDPPAEGSPKTAGP